MVLESRKRIALRKRGLQGEVFPLPIVLFFKEHSFVFRGDPVKTDKVMTQITSSINAPLITTVPP